MILSVVYLDYGNFYSNKFMFDLERLKRSTKSRHLADAHLGLYVNKAISPKYSLGPKAL